MRQARVTALVVEAVLLPASRQRQDQRLQEDLELGPDRGCTANFFILLANLLYFVWLRIWKR